MFPWTTGYYLTAITQKYTWPIRIPESLATNRVNIILSIQLKRSLQSKDSIVQHGEICKDQYVQHLRQAWVGSL